MFDPFSDFEERGYLRNVLGLKDMGMVKRFEHVSFLLGIEGAFADLRSVTRLQYGDVLKTHKTLFEPMYPWAGQDRAALAPEIAVSKGSVFFAHPLAAEPAVAYALKLAQDTGFMRKKSGTVMGLLAHGHPFFDGNGRSLMVIHAELAERAGFSIDWRATDRRQYLTALTAELDNPKDGILDAYLKPFLRPGVGLAGLVEHIAQIEGLRGSGSGDGDLNRVWGKYKALLENPAPLAKPHANNRSRAVKPSCK